MDNPPVCPAWAVSVRERSGDSDSTRKLTGQEIVAGKTSTNEHLAQLVRKCLEEGQSVDIDGLGVFRRSSGGYQFVAQSHPKVFLAYVEEDRLSADRLFDDLEQ